MKGEKNLYFYTNLDLLLKYTLFKAVSQLDQTDITLFQIRPVLKHAVISLNFDRLKFYYESFQRIGTFQEEKRNTGVWLTLTPHQVSPLLLLIFFARLQ